jgi:hypothetical protein
MTQGKSAGNGAWRDAFPGAWAWSGVSAVILVDLAWIAADPRMALSDWSLKFLAAGVGFAFLFWLLPMPNLQRVRNTALGLAFAINAFAAFRILNHLTMTLPLPLADERLAMLDASFGLDWRVYANWVAQQPRVIDSFFWAYGSLNQTTILGLAALFLVDRFDKAGEFVRQVFWCGLAAITIGMAFPATAAVAYFADPNLVAAFGPGAGTYHLPFLAALRSSDPVLLDFARMPGLVTFPSFHTACGLLLAYAYRDVRFLGPLVALYVAVMIASTPIMGGHYLVDLPAGALLAAAVIAVDHGLARRKRRHNAVTMPIEPVRAEG